MRLLQFSAPFGLAALLALALSPLACSSSSDDSSSGAPPANTSDSGSSTPDANADVAQDGAPAADGSSSQPDGAASDGAQDDGASSADGEAPKGKYFYVADAEGNQVHKFQLNASGPGLELWTRAVTQPLVVRTLRDGGVVAVGMKESDSDQRWTLNRFDAQGNPLWSHECCDDASFSAVFDVTEDSSGALWVSDRYNSRVFKFDTDGQIVATVPFSPQEVGSDSEIGPIVARTDGQVVLFTSGPDSDSTHLWLLSSQGEKTQDSVLTSQAAPMNALLDPLSPRDTVLAGFADSIQLFRGLDSVSSIASDSMTDEMAITPEGKLWRVYQDEPLILLLDRQGHEVLRLGRDEIEAKVAAYNAANGTQIHASGDYNRVGVGADGSLFVPSHSNVFHFSTEGTLLEVYTGFSAASDVD